MVLWLVCGSLLKMWPHTEQAQVFPTCATACAILQLLWQPAWKQNIYWSWISREEFIGTLCLTISPTSIGPVHVLCKLQIVYGVAYFSHVKPSSSMQWYICKWCSTVSSSLYLPSLFAVCIRWLKCLICLLLWCTALSAKWSSMKNCRFVMCRFFSLLLNDLFLYPV